LLKYAVKLYERLDLRFFMDATIYLARILGLYLLALGLLFLFRKRQVQTYFREIISSKSTFAITAMINFILGFTLVNLSGWSWDYRLLLSLFGYFMILRGALIFCFPVYMQRFSLNMMTMGYKIMITIQLILGVLLGYAGFAP
jgi:hypothetical protein